jgi:hypothetical protein
VDDLVKRRRRKRVQVTCYCQAMPHPHREGSKGCTPDTRDEAARQNEAEGKRIRLMTFGVVSEL